MSLPASGLRNPGGPVPAPDFGAALIAVGVWQALFFIGLRGWPVNLIGRRWLRLLAGNVLVIGLGVGSYLLARDLGGWQPASISAACGCVISAVLVVGMLFDNWPGSQAGPGLHRMLTLLLTSAVALALYRTLIAYADGVRWVRATPEDWVTTAALSFIGAGIILHVGIGLRWPFARPRATQRQ